MSDFKTLDDVSFQGQARYLLRADLNVPMDEGQVTDKDADRTRRMNHSRDRRQGRAWWCCWRISDVPRARRSRARVSHPSAEAVAGILDRKVSFADDCIGESAKRAVVCPG